MALHRGVQGELPVGPGEPVVLDHGQHERGGAHLQEVGDLGQVGVADDDVQPPVLLGVAVRLVAGVDDGPLQRGLEADLLLEEVGPLGQLEWSRRSRRSRTPRVPTLPAPV